MDRRSCLLLPEELNVAGKTAENRIKEEAEKKKKSLQEEAKNKLKDFFK